MRGNFINCVVRVAAVDALIASFMSIGTLALLTDMCETILVFLRKLVVMLLKRFRRRKCFFAGEIGSNGCWR